MRKKYQKWSFWLAILVCGMLMGAGLVIWRIDSFGSQLFKLSAQLEQKYGNMERIEALLQAEYFDQEMLWSGQQKMRDEALKAYVNGLGDPYTTFLDAESLSGLQHELEGQGQIEGIGAVVAKKDYYVQVEEVLKGSPAFYAGIEPLDRIVLIGTGETKDLSTTEAVMRIRGPKGTAVELFIERPSADGSNEYLKKEVIRDVIDIPSVRGKIINFKGVKIGHLEISIFGEETNRLLNQAISEFVSEKVQGIILDLRGNGGGLLPAAVDIAGHFLEPGKLVVTTKFRSFQEENLKAEGFGELSGMPVVVLIDGLSASASEILALALKDQRNAPVVGEKSFGKGSVQTLHEFSDQTSLKYTIGKRFSPKGESIDGVGIEPDIEVMFNGTGYREQRIDNQLLKAQEVLLGNLKPSNE